jgi:hypothetical protein
MIEVCPWLKQLIQVLMHEKLRDNHKKCMKSQIFIFIFN